jgi:hypothetical protein
VDFISVADISAMDLLTRISAGLKPCANPKSSAKAKTEADPYGMTTKKTASKKDKKATAPATAEGEATRNGNSGSNGNRNRKSRSNGVVAA